MYGEEELDVKRLRYALYARKSTDDPKKQVRSIKDQIDDCSAYASRLGLRIVGKPIQETKSAKKPGQRPKFTQLLKDLKAGKIDGILTWHPDRLSRNMREGGEVIDMIDEGQIKDLKFVTHHFSNDPQGKMILGLSFVLSKQYSDDLSQKVTRGNRKSFEEGKAWIPKHGYVNEDHFYRPDGKNFELLVSAWEMRKKGKTIEDIVEYLNNEGYFRQFKESRRKIKMSKSILSRIFRDPFYYGLMIQAGQELDLRKLYDFQPTVTEEDYNFVQSLTYKTKPPRKLARLAFYPLRRMVLCAFCGKECVVGPSPGRKGTRYLYYRCDNKKCIRNDKSLKPRIKASTRARVVFNFMYDFLKDGLNFTKKDYENYYTGITKLTEAKRQQLKGGLRSRQGAITVLKNDLEKLSLSLANLEPDSIAWKVTNNKISEIGVRQEKLQQNVENIIKLLAESKKDKLSLEQFLNLSKIAATKLKFADTVAKDKICRYIFLNLTIGDNKVVSYALKEPFKTLLENRKQAKILSGGHGGN